MQPQNHVRRFEEIFKTKSQASAASDQKIWQSQYHPRAKIRLSLNRLQVVHDQLFAPADIARLEACRFLHRSFT
jgi:hypothetical protein